tara:strand:+ start:5496 stop:6443 length:948 start_codon:yes stop_codon:yes gene_type:complete
MTTYVNTHTHNSNNSNNTAIKTTMATVQVPAEMFFQMIQKLDAIHSILTSNGIPVDMNSEVIKPKKTKKVKKAKDPNAPKRPNTAHCLFLKKKSAELKMGYKNTMSVPEVMAEWKEGTSADVIAAKNTASELKEKYNQEMAAYNANSTPAQVVADSDDESAPIVPKPILKKRRGRPKVAISSIKKKVVVVDPMAAILKEAAASKPDKTPEQLQMEELQRQQNELMAKMEATQASVLVPAENEEDDGLPLEEFNYEGTNTKFANMELGIDLTNNKVYTTEGEFLGVYDSNTKEIGDEFDELGDEFDELEEDDLEDE